MTPILLPSWPGQPNDPDPSFVREAEAAQKAGFKVGFVDIEMQLGGDVKFRKLPEGDRILYRGWLLTVADYDRLQAGLLAKGRKLIPGLEAYIEAYTFPRWYKKLREIPHPSMVAAKQGLTPRSLVEPWPEGEVPPEFLDVVIKAVQEEFGDKAVILKDYVKSRKQDWFDACYIPDVRDTDHVKKVVGNFLALNDGKPVGGLVFREFIEFERVGIHPKTKGPLINEWRAFMGNGVCFFRVPYWEGGKYEELEAPDVEWIEDVASKAGFISSFFAIDVAKRADGGWMVIEINDGGIAGVPENADLDLFYEELRAAV